MLSTIRRYVNEVSKEYNNLNQVRFDSYDIHNRKR